MTATLTEKQADLAGPGIGTYEEVEKVLPTDYRSLLDPKETQRAIFAVKRYIEDGLCRELEPDPVEVPLIVDRDSGVNDYLDRDGSRTPVSFHIEQRPRAQPDRGAGRAGGHQVEADGAEAVRHATWARG